jgi:hypothetical protein
LVVLVGIVLTAVVLPSDVAGGPTAAVFTVTTMSDAADDDSES